MLGFRPVGRSCTVRRGQPLLADLGECHASRGQLPLVWCLVLQVSLQHQLGETQAWHSHWAGAACLGVTRAGWMVSCRWRAGIWYLPLLPAAWEESSTKEQLCPPALPSPGRVAPTPTPPALFPKKFNSSPYSSGAFQAAAPVLELGVISVFSGPLRAALHGLPWPFVSLDTIPTAFHSQMFSGPLLSALVPRAGEPGEGWDPSLLWGTFAAEISLPIFNRHTWLWGQLILLFLFSCQASGGCFCVLSCRASAQLDFRWFSAMVVL